MNVNPLARSTSFDCVSCIPMASNVAAAFISSPLPPSPQIFSAGYATVVFTTLMSFSPPTKVYPKSIHEICASVSIISERGRARDFQFNGWPDVRIVIICQF